MTFTLRVVMFVVAFLTVIWILLRVRKAKVKVEDAVFWFCLAVVLLIMGIFPQIPYFVSDLLGIQTPANCVFLIIIALLIEKIFTLSIKQSQIEDKIDIMAAELAIRSKDIESKMEGKIQDECEG